MVHHTTGTSIYWVFFLLLIGMTGWMFWQQSRQQKTRKELQSSLKSGDRVVTIGGVIGTVRQVKDNQLVLEIAEGVRIHVLKSAIGSKYESNG
ncbi:preprotein translocase, YajC subunit [Sulfobacillus acidophilus TPY]|uniref:Protein translocase subunit yajC n=1 Tax=Sulfobacillus acidophilus (strain ATCC 700253 / DSM 10332 / NAL) TaxID=679936 RepID=G8TWZ8_SULAD|nr:preprotein translocase, YajC subunit [Sulfobacillus acidophilus TPY]AEW04906.1 protein translocase subunit yajC [Sulfobacillus acidophilus DSM 10332]MCY0863542.1 preprotein translocase subunit YajC [Sulfobacillus sp.]